MDQAELTRDPFDVFLRNIYERRDPNPAGRSFYSKAGDCVFAYFEGGPHVRERVDSLLTLYRSLAEGRVIGFQVKEINKLKVRALSGRVVPASEDQPADVFELLLWSLQSERLEQNIAQQEAAWNRAARYAEAVRAVNGQPAEVEGLELAGCHN